MARLLVIAAAVAFAVALLATSGAAAPPDRSPMFSFCDGRLAEIPEVRLCADGSLRIVR
jgi:hypothetical protein